MLKKSLALSAVLHLMVVIAIVFRMDHTPPLLKSNPIVVTMAALPQPPQLPPKVTPAKSPPPQAVMPQKVSKPTPMVAPVATKPALVKEETRSPITPTPVETPVAKPIETISPPAPKKQAQVDTSSIKNQYLGYLVQTIQAHKAYPNKAKRLGQTGTVEVTFTVMADGSITNIRVKQTSSFGLLDKAAADIFTLLAKVRPIPKELGKESWEFTLPINYQLT